MSIVFDIWALYSGYEHSGISVNAHIKGKYKDDMSSMSEYTVHKNGFSMAYTGTSNSIIDKFDSESIYVVCVYIYINKIGSNENHEQ